MQDKEIATFVEEIKKRTISAQFMDFNYFSTKRPPSKRRWVDLATESRISAKADKMFQAKSPLKFIIGSCKCLIQTVFYYSFIFLRYFTNRNAENNMKF